MEFLALFHGRMGRIGDEIYLEILIPLRRRHITLRTFVEDEGHTRFGRPAGFWSREEATLQPEPGSNFLQCRSRSSQHICMVEDARAPKPVVSACQCRDLHDSGSVK